ncbi:methylthioribulose 1-phosphate dehydratase [Ectobacillus antri]|jgi:methylthioribulose-1-phosphate dehydratase|uniref:Methylthioribulose-1-phosphate dehydratase n=1 Tax=Ectobacillus antri TaxID=2486280 RepID=A0ABT6H0I5_9BACI|nr:methylthioribulose 1-phosphate dehydratase [Ectobacillus antri]MDG4655732.1 methylthioribulose 1-phosphate dehydratase [Ectobacillus antri]MDG5752407.1 methylthioribulose 1-phosphate dehydratase [Ectobacillus antri]
MKQYWNELSEIKKDLAAKDWFPATSGNISIKVSDEPLQFLITASGKDKTKITPEDFLLVDKTGRAIEETHLRPSAETLLHVHIYNQTKAGCVLHVHTIENNVISSLYEHEVTIGNQEIIKALDIWEEGAKITIPIIENYADIPLLGETFLPHITGDTGAVLIRNHGITVWGKNGFDAKRRLEAYEFLFRFHLKLCSLQGGAYHGTNSHS